MRNRFVLLAALLGAGVAAAPAAAQQTGTKIGYVNSEAILAQAPGSEAIRNQMQQIQQSFAQRLQPLEDSLQTMLTNYQQQQAMLSPEARQARQQEITTKQQAFQQQAQALEQQMLVERNAALEPLMARINDVIQQYRQANGFAIILDASSGIMVAADESLDLTEEIIALLGTGGGSAPPPQR